MAGAAPSIEVRIKDRQHNRIVVSPLPARSSLRSFIRTTWRSAITVHTSLYALLKGKAEIQRIRGRIIDHGRL